MLDEFLVANLFQVFLVFARMGAAVMVLPAFGEGFVFPRARLCFALVLAIALAPVVAPSLPAAPDSTALMLWIVIREVLIGLALGGIVRFLVSAVGIAGAIVATQTGIATASLFDPSQGDQIAVVGRFLSIAAMVALFAADLHLPMLAALAESYQRLPPLAPPEVGDVTQLALDWFAGAFDLAARLAAPLVVGGVVFYLGLGTLARLMPQVPVFFVIIPVQLGAGIALFMVALSAMILWYLDFVSERLGSLVGG